MFKFKFTYSNGRTFSFAIPIGFLLSGYFFMLLMGILHINVDEAIPAIGYGLSTLIMLMVNLITWCHSGTSD